MSRNVTKCYAMLMPNLWIATKCNGMQMPCSRNVMECRSRNNGMLQIVVQTDLGTCI